MIRNHGIGIDLIGISWPIVFFVIVWYNQTAWTPSVCCGQGSAAPLRCVSSFSRYPHGNPLSVYPAFRLYSRRLIEISKNSGPSYQSRKWSENTNFIIKCAKNYHAAKSAVSKRFEWNATHCIIEKWTWKSTFCNNQNPKASRETLTGHSGVAVIREIRQF